ncbi:MAG: hypothetical protein OK454_03020, partial [Thaumarchaeota archaeon]|nr:hypothetical protein [Nitrososphaerota archaeon]
EEEEGNTTANSAARVGPEAGIYIKDGLEVGVEDARIDLGKRNRDVERSEWAPEPGRAGISTLFFFFFFHGVCSD